MVGYQLERDEALACAGGVDDGSLAGGRQQFGRGVIGGAVMRKQFQHRLHPSLNNKISVLL